MDLPEVQAAVRRIEGVAAASIRWPDPLGPASLRVEFDEGVDHRDIGEAIIRTLVDVADVDLATMHLERGDPVVDRPRPVFTALGLDRVDDELSVEVDVLVDGHRTPGRAAGLLTAVGELPLVAQATLDALHRTGAGPFALVQVDRLPLSTGDDVIAVAVDVGEGRRPLIGAAMVVADPREATVRATLDAVNRVLPATPAARGLAQPPT